MADMPWGALVSAAEKSGFGAPAPVGTYQARVETAEAGTSKAGNPVITCRLKITEGPQAGKKATTFDHYITKSEAAAGMFIANMTALGVTVDVLVKHNPTMDQLARAITGKTVTAVTRVSRGRKTNEGEDIVEVAGVLKAPTGGAQAVTSFPPVSAAAQLGYGSAPAAAAPAPAINANPDF